MSLLRVFYNCSMQTPKGDSWKPKPSITMSRITTSEASTVRTVKKNRVNRIETMPRQNNIGNVKWDSDYDETEDSCVPLVSNSQSLKEVEPVS